MLLLCIIFTLAATTSGLVKSDQKNEFGFTSTLDDAGSFQLAWTFDNDTITFQVQAATKGWAGIGFSPNGAMTGADIVVFGIDQSGNKFLSDRHADHNGYPSEDKHQDYNLISLAKNETHLNVKFSRKRNTCDVEDWPLTRDTTRVIYASNDVMPENKDNFQKHKFTGGKSLHFFDKTSEYQTLPEKDAHPIEYHVDKVEVPSDSDTLYWCKVFPFPKMDKKQHVIKVEPVIQAGNKDVLHHIIVYLCTENVSNYTGHGQACYEEEGRGLLQCMTTVLTGWSKGGESIIYPEDIGLAFYSNSENSYLIMQVHYDNSQFKKGKVDSSGLKLWVTDQLRPKEATLFRAGIQVTPQYQVIPPKQPVFKMYSYCSAQCTNRLPTGGITIIGGFMHTHLTGVKVHVMHFRNGKQLPHILNDEYFDFNYQDYKVLEKPVVVLQGDEIVLECVYDTSKKNKTMFSGLGTSEEMCQFVATYYPAIEGGFACYSSINSRKLFAPMGINFAPNTIDDVLLPNGHTKPLGDYLKQDYQFNWTNDSAKEWEKANKDVQHNIYCIHNSEGPTNYELFVQDGYPNVTEPLVTPDLCAKEKAASMV
jgi:hypothetical protein